MVAQWIDSYDFLGTEKPIDLTEEMILRWADEYYEKHNKWPTENSGKINKRISWKTINSALKKRRYKNIKNHSLANFLQEKRNYRNKNNLPNLTEEQILKWADEYFEKHGEWPSSNSGKINGTNESWGNISYSLRDGLRNLKKYYSLPYFLREKRNKEYHRKMPNITIKEIMIWIDNYFNKNNSYPTRGSKKIEGTNETWNTIDNALLYGKRGLNTKISLSQLINQKRPSRIEIITEEQILQWADEYYEKHGKYPKYKDGKIENTNKNWKMVNSWLRNGYKGLPGGSSLAKLLEEKRGVKRKYNLPNLTEKKILQWADKYYKKHGKYPKSNSGKIEGTNETWFIISHSLVVGVRGFPGGSSLAKLLERERGIKNIGNLKKLTEKQILQLIYKYFEKHGKYPNNTSGIIEEIDISWRNISVSLKKGYRGLPGGITLRQFIKKI